MKSPYIFILLHLCATAVICDPLKAKEWVEHVWPQTWQPHPRLTQRLRQRGCWAAVQNIMNLILQVHNSCEGPITTSISMRACFLMKRRVVVAWCSKPHCQRPVQSNIKHIKPERPVGLTPEPCYATRLLLRDRGWRTGEGRWCNEVSLHVWLLFGVWLVELRLYFSAAGTILTKRAVAVQKIATGHWGHSFNGHGRS